MDWHEFDIEDAERVLESSRRAFREEYGHDHIRPGSNLAIQLEDLETAIDQYHRFTDLDLSLLTEEDDEPAPGAYGSELYLMRAADGL